jgi:uncharacterized protein YhaN
MRLTELSFEKYGCYSERLLTIPEHAGLTVVYGLNEAGKSTCLEAIGDFLFGIPGRSARGETFGYPGMRIGALMRLANDEVMALRRRKGHGRTLVDEKGAACDDSLLASTALGAINRERFETLFGLNHETLRSGGDDLLDANGDIGRLIVEAGGGLRAMVRRIAEIDDEAGKLFARTRNQSKKFYEALSRYETAEKAGRTHLLSRDTYEDARKDADGARKAADALRAERETLRATIYKLERVVRVGPHLRQRDQLVGEIESFAGTVGYPEEFSTQVRDALKARDDAEESHRKVGGQHDEVKGKIDGLVVSENLAAAQKMINLLSEDAVKVSSARESRPNRVRDLDIEEAKLHPLQEMLGMEPDADVAGMLPDRAATDRVQTLAAEALEKGSVLASAEGRVSELADELAQIETRIAEDRSAGYNRPLGVAASQFGSLVVQKASLDARRGNAEEEKRGIEKDVAWFGGPTAEELAAMSCPSAEDVRAEQTAREEIGHDIAEQERVKRKADEEIAAALEEIAALEAGGPVATVTAVAEARVVREGLWRPIREAFVEGRAGDSLEARRSAAEAFEGGSKEADSLSDRRADEVGRVALRTELERTVTRARRKAREAEREIAELAKRLTAREEAFCGVYPDLSNRYSALASLLEFSSRRNEVLDRIATTRVEAADIGVKTNELAPAIDLLERVEARLGLDPTAGFSARVEAIQAAIGEHDRRRSGLEGAIAKKEEVDGKLKAATDKRDEARAWKEGYDRSWPGAMKALGGSATASPADGNKLAGEWREARGILRTIAEIRTRLKHMDDDEAKLLEDVLRTARELGIDVAEDGVVGARMLQTRWTENDRLRTKRDELKEKHEVGKLEAETAAEAVKVAGEALTALASAIGAEVDNLTAAAARFDERRAIEGKIADAERLARNAGDQLPVTTLETEWASRDLDAVRLDLESAQSRLKEIDGDVENAILKESEGREALHRFASDSEVNRAIVERESARADMHAAVERYLELSLASDLIAEAMATVRAEQQDPLIARASVLFAAMTEGEFLGIETDVDESGAPVVKGKRANGETESVARLSDGTRDQLFLAFRLASLESYGESAEPLPFVADDILVHFDGPRARATLELLADFGKRNQMLLFTHEESVRDAAAELVKEGRANLVELPKGA